MAHPCLGLGYIINHKGHRAQVPGSAPQDQPGWPGPGGHGAGPLLLDRFMPSHHFGEYHQALAAAPAWRAYQALLELDMTRSPLVAGLLMLRELPVRLARRDFKSPGLGRTLEQMQAFGFILLAEDSPRELVLGLVGRFWSPRPRIVRLKPQEFAGFAQSGYAKVAANLLAWPLGPGLCQLSTETRIQCQDLKTRARFRAYWSLIRPFSGLTRREWLRLARQAAEAPPA